MSIFIVSMPMQKNSTKYQNMLPYILPISGCFAELLRAASIIFTKAFAEIGGIGKAGLLADLYDLLLWRIYSDHVRKDHAVNRQYRI